MIKAVKHRFETMEFKRSFTDYWQYLRGYEYNFNDGTCIKFDYNTIRQSHHGTVDVFKSNILVGQYELFGNGLGWSKTGQAIINLCHKYDPDLANNVKNFQKNYKEREKIESNVASDFFNYPKREEEERVEEKSKRNRKKPWWRILFGS